MQLHTKQAYAGTGANAVAPREPARVRTQKFEAPKLDMNLTAQEWEQWELI